MAQGSGNDQAQGSANSQGGGNGQGGGHIDGDIAALLQALQQGNATAINNAVTTLGNDVHAGAPDAGIPHFNLAHIEHMWS